MVGKKKNQLCTCDSPVQILNSNCVVLIYCDFNNKYIIEWVYLEQN